MSKLFIEIFLDENMDVRIASIIRARGFKAVTTDDTGRKGATDADQLRYCADHGYAILTANRVDFELLAKEYFYTGQKHSEIIITPDNSPHVIAQRLNDYLDFNTADETENQLVYI